MVAQCLGSTQRRTLAHLTQQLKRAMALGARPFEVIVGSPHLRYGARITFDLTHLRGRVTTATFDPTLAWDTPDWVGLRVIAERTPVWKSYYRHPRHARQVLAPPDLPSTLRPVMASRHDGTDELYFRLVAESDWHTFVTDFTRRFQLERDVPPFYPLPCPRPHAFGLSLKVAAGRVVTVSFYADDRSLPEDRAMPTEWSRGMTVEDAEAYARALAAVRTTGQRPARGWHAAIAWTVDRATGWSRSVSLRLRAGAHAA